MAANNHSHVHIHNHGHTQGTGDIAVAFFLNTGFAIIELAGGVFTNSVAIMSDALHDLGDSFSLGTAWYFQKKSRQGSSQSYTYGYRRFALIGAFINSIVLIAGSILIIREAIKRLIQPEQVHPAGMLMLAVAGIIVNGAAMLRLKKGGTINEKIVSLHFLEDVLGWVAVLIGAIVMMYVHIPVLDPVLSLLIASFILFNVYRNIKPAFKIILQGVPNDTLEQEIRQVTLNQPEVTEVHDFHLWTLDGAHHILSMHIVVRDNMNLTQAEQLKERIKGMLQHIDVAHATIEVEYNPEHCKRQSFSGR